MSIIPEKLPPGWRAAKLGEIVTLNPSRSKKLLDDDIVSFLAMPDVSEEGRVLNKQSRTFASVRNGFTTFENGDVLVAKITPCFENGKGALVDELENGVGFGSTEFHVVRALDPEDRLFVQLHTSSKQFRLLGEHMMTGSAGHKRVPADFIRGYKIPLPPPEQRHRITGLLNTWDEAIQLQTKLLSDLRTRQRAVAQRLLSGDVRLPSFTEKWETKPLNTYFARSLRKNSEGNTNVLTISAQQGLISQRDYFNKSVSSDEVTGYYLLHKGDFAYNKSYSAGYPLGALKRLDLYEKGVVSPLYICFSLVSGSSDFFTHYFDSGFFNKELARIAQEGSRNHGLLNVSSTDFFNLLIKAPHEQEQQAIADVLNTGAAEIRLRQTELTDLREQKRGLMQKLLTGRALLH